MKKIVSVVLANILLILSSCGNSPLFNHKMAPDAPTVATRGALDPGNSAENPGGENNAGVLPGQTLPDPVQDLPGQPTATNPCPLFFVKADLCAKITWESGHLPQGEDESVFVVRFWKKSDAVPTYVDPALSVKVVLFMPSMGHGAPATRIQKLAEGTYKVNRASFFMPGDWEVRVQLLSATNLIYDQAILPLMVSGD